MIWGVGGAMVIWGAVVNGLGCGRGYDIVGGA